MRPEEKLHRAIWEILDELVQGKIITPKDEWVSVSASTPELKRAVRALKNSTAVRIIKDRKQNPPFNLGALFEMQGVELATIGYYVEPLEPRFSEVVDTYYNILGIRLDRTLSTDDSKKLSEKLAEWRNEPLELPSATNEVAAKPNEVKQVAPVENKIEKLTFIQPEKKDSNKLTVVVNEDYSHPCIFDSKKPSGKLLAMIMQGEETIPYAEYKEPFDYLNGSKNQMITTTGCVKTKILTSEVGYITPTVGTEVIGEKAFNQRRVKALKNA